MKKSIFIVLLTLLVCQSSYCVKNEITIKNSKKQTIEQLFNEFSKEKNTTHIKIGGFLMSFAKVFTDTKGVSGVEVFSFDECSKSVITDFNEAVKNIEDKSYETLFSTNENGEKTKILIKIKDDLINEIVVIAGGDRPALVRIKGKIKPDEIKNVIEKNK